MFASSDYTSYYTTSSRKILSMFIDLMKTRSLWSLHPWRYSKAIWTWPGQLAPSAWAWAGRLDQM